MFITQFLVLHGVKSPIFFFLIFYTIQPKMLATVLLGAFALLLVLSAQGARHHPVGALGSFCFFAAHRSGCWGTCVLFFR